LLAALCCPAAPPTHKLAHKLARAHARARAWHAYRHTGMRTHVQPHARTCMQAARLCRDHGGQHQQPQRAAAARGLWRVRRGQGGAPHADRWACGVAQLQGCCVCVACVWVGCLWSGARCTGWGKAARHMLTGGRQERACTGEERQQEHALETRQQEHALHWRRGSKSMHWRRGKKSMHWRQGKKSMHWRRKEETARAMQALLQARIPGREGLPTPQTLSCCCLYGYLPPHHHQNDGHPVTHPHPPSPLSCSRAGA